MNKGQSLFEVVVAIAISALVIGAIVSLATISIRNSTYSKNQSLASGYAQQATEWLRGQRDTNIANFIAKAGPQNGTTTYCLPDLTDLTSLTPVGTPASCSNPIANTSFTRYVSFKPTTSPTAKTLIETDVTVFWTDSQGTHEVTSATDFTDWRQR